MERLPAIQAPKEMDSVDMESSNSKLRIRFRKRSIWRAIYSKKEFNEVEYKQCSIQYYIILRR